MSASDGAAGSPGLSVVTPVFNEGAVVGELVQRVVATCRELGVDFEVIVVDDCSDDDGPAVLAGLQANDPVVGPALRVVRPARNGGQFTATLLGLSQARGQRVVVLDGDLQDPPEVIASLWHHAQALGPEVHAIFATKARRDDPAWFLAGRAIFHGAQRLLARARVPSGAGSYVLLARPLAMRASRVALRDANLSSVVVALGARCATVPYDKQARYDGRSRVGLWGLCREALGSLALTGALSRGLRILGTASLALTGLALMQKWHPGLQVGGAALTLTLLMADKGVRRRVLRALGPALPQQLYQPPVLPPNGPEVIGAAPPVGDPPGTRPGAPADR